jgi:hypothetical protein
VFRRRKILAEIEQQTLWYCRIWMTSPRVTVRFVQIFEKSYLTPGKPDDRNPVARAVLRNIV